MLPVDSLLEYEAGTTARRKGDKGLTINRTLCFRASATESSTLVGREVGCAVVEVLDFNLLWTGQAGSSTSIFSEPSLLAFHRRDSRSEAFRPSHHAPNLQAMALNNCFFYEQFSSLFSVGRIPVTGYGGWVALNLLPRRG